MCRSQKTTVRDSSPPPPRGFQEPNSASQAWWQVSFPDEPPCWPQVICLEQIIIIVLDTEIILKSFSFRCIFDLIPNIRTKPNIKTFCLPFHSHDAGFNSSTFVSVVISLRLCPFLAIWEQVIATFSFSSKYMVCILFFRQCFLYDAFCVFHECVCVWAHVWTSWRSEDNLLVLVLFPPSGCWESNAGG